MQFLYFVRPAVLKGPKAVRFHTNASPWMCVRARACVLTRLLFRLMCLNVPGVRTKARPHHLSPPPTHCLSLSVANNNPDCFTHLKRPISSNALMPTLTWRVAAKFSLLVLFDFFHFQSAKDSAANIVRGSLFISHSNEATSCRSVLELFCDRVKATRRLIISVLNDFRAACHFQ